MARSQPRRLGAHAVGGGELGGDLVQAILAPGDQDQVVAAGGQLAGDRGADAGRGSGDQGRAGGGGGGQAHERAAYRPPPERGELLRGPVSPLARAA